MAWRYHGHASVNPTSPRAWGVCDVCGRLFNLDDLKFQVEWRGTRLMPNGLRVCKYDYDRPFPFYRPVILPVDPQPVFQARPEQLTAEMDQTGQLPPPGLATTSQKANSSQ